LFTAKHFSYLFSHSFDRNTFIVVVGGSNEVSVFRDEEVIQFNVQLPMVGLIIQAVATTYVDGEPCIVVAGYGNGAGVYLRHAVTLCEVRSLPTSKDVTCVCNVIGSKLFFGTTSGWKYCFLKPDSH
jgi:hypothetical protein